MKYILAFVILVFFGCKHKPDPIITSSGVLDLNMDSLSKLPSHFLKGCGTWDTTMFRPVDTMYQDGELVRIILNRGTIHEDTISYWGKLDQLTSKPNKRKHKKKVKHEIIEEMPPMHLLDSSATLEIVPTK